MAIFGELVGVKMTVPEEIGVIVNDCDAALLLKVKGIVVFKPAPDTAILIVPV